MNWFQFRYRDAYIRVRAASPDAVRRSVRQTRAILESWIAGHPLFATSFTPVETEESAPGIVRDMMHAAECAGTGPMAAVAGAVAECAVRDALEAGETDCIVENGGDIFMSAGSETVVSLYSGRASAAGNLALKVRPEDRPLAICSSSGKMGQSLSLGEGDLATVLADNGALADAAATQAANWMKGSADLNDVAARVLAIAGIRGVILFQGGLIAMGGRLPPLVRVRDSQTRNRITHAEGWDFNS